MNPIDSHAVYNDPRHYDALNDFTNDIPFYESLVYKYGKKVLELASGTGRVTIPLAKIGCSITGIDISANFVEYAKQKAENNKVSIPFYRADMRSFDLGEKFDLILLPFNALCHIQDYTSIINLLDCVKAHLRATGKFIISVFTPKCHYLNTKADIKKPVAKYPNPYNTNEEVIIYEENAYNYANQINYITWYVNTDGVEEKQGLNMRMYFPEEIDNYLKMNGFKLDVKYGEYTFTPFTSTSPFQLIVASLA